MFGPGAPLLVTIQSSSTYVDDLQYVRGVGGGFGDSLPADVIERFDVRIGWVVRVALQPDGFAVVRAVSTS